MIDSGLPRQGAGKRIFQSLLNAAVFTILRPKIIWEDENVKKRGNKEQYIFVCNHTHHFDGVCAAAVLRKYKPYALVSRKWYDKRGYGTLIKLTRSIPINLNELDASWYMTGEKLMNKGESMLIFPEGGVARDGKMLEFKSGAGLLAAKANVKVVPMASYGKYNMFVGKRQIIKVGRPIDSSCPESMRYSKYAKQLMQQAEFEVKRMYGGLEREHGDVGTYFEESYK